jgi:hypothetical protein
VRRTALLEVGGFNVLNRTTWDGELLTDLALAGKRFRRINEYWSLFTLHGESISASHGVARQHALDRERQFQKVMGRSQSRFDEVMRVAVRLEKWLRDPRSTAIRAADTLALRRLPALPLARCG